MPPEASNLITDWTPSAVAGVLFWVSLKLYSKVEQLQKRIEDLLEARRLDALESRRDVTDVLPGIARSLEGLNDKMEVVKPGRRR